MRQLASSLPQVALLLLLVGAAISPSLLADSPAIPTPYATTSADGRFVFVMLPGKEDWSGHNSRGIAYELTWSGEWRELWRTQGWYSFRVHLAEDGQHLVRMGPWNAGAAPSEKDLAVAFYREGSLVKSYSTAELVRDHARVRASTSHYEWLADFPVRPELSLDGSFSLQTIDGVRYRFSATTGAITSVETERESAQGWATARDIDLLLIRILLQNGSPFPARELNERLRLPPKAKLISVGYGRDTQSQELALTSGTYPFTGYVLQVTHRANGARMNIATGPSGEVIGLSLRFRTPDERTLAVEPSADLRRTVDAVRTAQKGPGKGVAELAEEVLAQLNGRGVFR